MWHPDPKEAALNPWFSFFLRGLRALPALHLSACSHPLHLEVWLLPFHHHQLKCLKWCQVCMKCTEENRALLVRSSLVSGPGPIIRVAWRQKNLFNLKKQLTSNVEKLWCWRFSGQCNSKRWQPASVFSYRDKGLGQNKRMAKESRKCGRLVWIPSNKPAASCLGQEARRHEFCCRHVRD